MPRTPEVNSHPAINVYDHSAEKTSFPVSGISPKGFLPGDTTVPTVAVPNRRQIITWYVVCSQPAGRDGISVW